MQQKNREASVIVQPSWKIIEEMDFPRLTKLSLRPSKDATDLYVSFYLDFRCPSICNQLVNIADRFQVWYKNIFVLISNLKRFSTQHTGSGQILYFTRGCYVFFDWVSSACLTSVHTSRLMCGELEYYDKKYDRVTVKNEQRLMRIDRIFHKVTTTDDPVIRRVRQEQRW